MRRPRPQGPESDCPSEQYNDNMMQILGIGGPDDINPTTTAQPAGASGAPASSGPVNEWEAAARLKKARAIADQLRAEGRTAEGAEMMSDFEWREVQARAGLKKNPASHETRLLVLRILGGVQK